VKKYPPAQHRPEEKSRQNAADAFWGNEEVTPLPALKSSKAFQVPILPKVKNITCTYFTYIFVTFNQ
jgi:hypothetical protein